MRRLPDRDRADVLRALGISRAALEDAVRENDKARFEVRGKRIRAFLVVEGAATVDAGALQVADVVVRARGTGSIRVCATATFKVYGSGADQVVLDCG